MFRSIKFGACGFRFWGDFYPRRTLPVRNWDMNCVRNHVNRFEVGWVFLPISQANVYSMSDILEMWISDIFKRTSCPKIETNCSTTSYPFECLLTNWIAFFSLEQSTTIITLNAKEFTFQPFQLILLYVLTCDGILLKALKSSISYTIPLAYIDHGKHGWWVRFLSYLNTFILLKLYQVIETRFFESKLLGIKSWRLCDTLSLSQPWFELFSTFVRIKWLLYNYLTIRQL